MLEPDVRWSTGRRLVTISIGLLLLVYLVRRTGPSRLLEGIASVGWGLIFVIALAGLSHVVRTWAWRVTLLDARHRPSFVRMLALRLVSEAAGQVGALGQLFGDTWRVAGLGAEPSLDVRITSVALDRTLYALSSTIVTIAGIASVAFLLPPSDKVAVYAAIFGLTLLAGVFLAIVAVQRRLAVLSRSAGALGRFRKVGRWLEGRQETIRSVEDRLFDFFHHSPAAFWESFGLQMAGQAAALLEVYIVLRLMGYRAGFPSALTIEGFTKLLSLIGMINPGNAGTFEGGNMLLTKLVGVGATAGLTLGLIRRIRALFWAAVGAICAVLLPGSAKRGSTKAPGVDCPARNGHTAIILAQGVPASSALARVGELPVLLRAILGEQKAGAARIVVVVDPARATRFREELWSTRRLPEGVEWYQSNDGDIRGVLRAVAESNERIVLLAADSTYHPSLHRRAAEWAGPYALAFTTGGQPVGIYVLNTSRSIAIGKEYGDGRLTIADLYEYLTATNIVTCDPVPLNLWQRVLTSEDHLLAEQKLDKWLFKATDVFIARMNRRISIPISRQLIHLPITPNMVSLFTLGVSFLAGVFFARGGPGNMLVGATLSVFASILDGCDGEVARLTLQESAFGCWLETVCDYLYYVFLFVGMMVGLLNRNHTYLIWGTVLLFGAASCFLMTALQRRRMAGSRPEQYLSLWRAEASRRSSNPFLYVGRHTEFLIKRCCLPYLVLVFALFGAVHMAFIGAAVGANIVWPIVLYSYVTFDPTPTPHD